MGERWTSPGPRIPLERWFRLCAAWPVLEPRSESRFKGVVAAPVTFGGGLFEAEWDIRPGHAGRRRQSKYSTFARTASWPPGNHFREACLVYRSEAPAGVHHEHRSTARQRRAQGERRKTVGPGAPPPRWKGSAVPRRGNNTRSCIRGGPNESNCRKTSGKPRGLPATAPQGPAERFLIAWSEFV